MRIITLFNNIFPFQPSDSALNSITPFSYIKLTCTPVFVFILSSLDVKTSPVMWFVLFVFSLHEF